jgi:membrane-associated phospholipid phosphatase
VWLVALVVVILTLMARVWAGDHWPSDVLGGFLLGLGWSALILWLPERYLPSPSLGWVRRRRGSRRPA